MAMSEFIEPMRDVLHEVRDWAYTYEERRLEGKTGKRARNVLRHRIEVLKMHLRTLDLVLKKDEETD